MAEKSQQTHTPGPRTRSSNYHLENNPFELSFSQPHPNPSAPAFAPPTPKDVTRPELTTDTDDRPKLPPIAAMASPADFAWAYGGSEINSLRSGPLSPAMLAGPAQYGSVNAPSGFGTGLTPDVSRTGLTPLIGGPTSFPPPSPNTAAFIAMVGANGANSQAGVGTITPGTLSAITGAMFNGNGTGINGGSSDASSSLHTSPPNKHPLSVSHVPGDHNSSKKNNNNSTTTLNEEDAAANGLFLLSQAHHELAKREEEQQQTTNTSSNAPSRAPPKQAGKRKSSSAIADQAPPPTPKRARPAAANSSKTATSNRRTARKKSEAPSSIGDDDQDMSDDGDDGVGASDDEELDAAARVGTLSGGRGGPKRPETEEEKRKNFLERNRQAALKCRQRKKAWLNQLQAKVEYLTAENERLQNTTVNMREEISRLSAVVVAHRDCGLGGVSVARSEALITAAGGGVGSNIKDEAGVPSNAPTRNGNGGGVSSNASGTASPVVTRSTAHGGATTRRAAASVSSASASPVPQPQMVSVGGGGSGGGKGRYY